MKSKKAEKEEIVLYTTLINIMEWVCFKKKEKVEGTRGQKR